MKKLLLFILLGLYSTLSYAQSNFSVTYGFDGVTSSTGRTDPTAPPTASNVTFSSFTSVGASANPNASARFSFTSWPLGATNNTDDFTGSIDLTKYYEVTITPGSNYTLSLTNLIFTLQRSGTGIRQYAVRSSIDNFASNLSATINPSNSNLSVVATNTFQVSDPSTTALNGSTITFDSNHSSTAPIIIRFYGFNAEASGGTFSIDNVTITGSTTLSNVNAPLISSNPTSLAFGSQNINTTYTEKALELTYSNLTNADLTLSTAAPFIISKTSNGIYGTSLIYTNAERTSPTTLYVKYAPTSIGNNTGSLAISGAGLSSTTNVALTGFGLDPNFEINSDYVQLFNDPNYLINSYWKQVSVKGSAKTWEYTSSNPRTGAGAAYMNGFSETETDGDGNKPSDDWLISPKMNLTAFPNYPIVSFWSRKWFAGPTLKVYVSTTYNGSAAINLADWTEITSPGLPNTTGVWLQSNNIDLSAYKTAATYIAFRYATETGSNGNAAEWRIDDFSLTNKTATSSIPKNTITFTETSVGSTSTSKSFNFSSSGYGDITINAPSDFEISADNASFHPSLTVLAADAVSAKTIYARFKPSTTAAQISGALTFSGTGLTENGPTLLGSSLLKSNTFDLATWNMEFFGNGTAIAGSFGPTDRNLQINNAATVYNNMLPDVIGIQEISDETAVDELLTKLPSTYKKRMSQVYSYSIKPPTSNDPFPVQKLGFIYNSATVDTVGFRAMFVGIYKDAVAGTTIPVAGNSNNRVDDGFWSSGRLPFIGTFNVTTLDGLRKKVNVVVIHAKSGGNTTDYNRRVIDVQVLKDSLTAQYPGENNAIIGDYNDFVVGSNAGNLTSPFKVFTDNGYKALTLDLLNNGKGTYVGSTNPSMIDNIIVSNELDAFTAINSTAIEDARDYISGYATNTSDHLPVYARFSFPIGTLPVKFENFTAKQEGAAVILRWSTASESNNNYFTVERSTDGVKFEKVKDVASNGNANQKNTYSAIDNNPKQGRNYYRLKQTDLNGDVSYFTEVRVVNILDGNAGLLIYPNPVKDKVTINYVSTSSNIGLSLISNDGRLIFKSKGSVKSLEQQLNSKIASIPNGLYIVSFTENGKSHREKLVKH
ncbi:T9SS-dependent choice-of-anchor J family protein [Pedobacter ureilyticus]|uniref:T9SS-dependent choice-of-anchor J family protein n=1 Tax=Pedobacter ureilyticus TaxID=1393051 RepID=A0ABW9JCZ2_9SPHI|nr:choice-of-anchor J domain-containing protein [Pedobacter helvus]